MSGPVDPNMFTTPFQLTKAMRRDVYASVDPKTTSVDVTGKVVLIAGPAGGLGYVITHTWSSLGAKGIILVGRDEKKLQAVASELKSPTLVAAGDLGVESDVQKIFARAAEKFGNVDVVINSAGITHTDPIGKLDPASWWQNFEINLKGTYNLLHHFILSSGGQGTFINFVSLGASLVSPGMSGYGTSQLAAIRLGEYADLEQPNLRYFSIHPGIVEAESGRGGVIDAFTPFAKDKQALSAGVTVYLQKPEADFLRGAYVSVNWDVDEMQEHKEEIVDKKLLKLGFIGAKVGPEGHPWES